MIWVKFLLGRITGRYLYLVILKQPLSIPFLDDAAQLGYA